MGTEKRAPAPIGFAAYLWLQLLLLMNKILCIGEALIDMICTDRDTPLSQGEQFLSKPGGAPTNVAAAIGALGGQVSLVAKVGQDPFGQKLVDVMEGFQVDTRLVLRDPERFTTFAFVSLLGNGERDFVFNRGADGQLSVADLQGLDFSDYAIVHFGSATGFLPGPLQESYRYALAQAKAAGSFISFDPNFRKLLFPGDTAPFVAHSIDFIRQCDFYKVSDEEALLLTGASKIEEAVVQLQELSKAAFAITIGSEGTIFRLGQDVITVPSIRVAPVDTTGAGDAFVGALLYQLSTLDKNARNNLGFDQWQVLVANANKAGARTCTYMGAMEAFRHLSAGIFEA